MPRNSLPFLRSMFLTRLLVPLAIAGFGFFNAAWAEPGASDWFQTQQGRVRLIAAEPSVSPADAVVLGLQFELAAHWKIYWRTPGDAGFPPELDFAGSDNLAGETIQWPAPRRFSVQGLETTGYEGAVVLPIAARLARPGQPLHLVASLRYLTCETICIPYETELHLDLPASTGLSPKPAFRDLIEHYLALVPGDGAAVGLHLDSASFVPGEKPELLLQLTADPPLSAPDAFVEGPEGLAFGKPALEPGAGPDHPVLRLPVTLVSKGGTLPNGVPLRVTVVDGERSLEASTVSSVATAVARGFENRLVILLVALLGGLVLNVMPCVLPVLSLKFLSLIEAGTKGAALVRRQFLASAAGILASFLALAGALIVARRAGIAIGWGLQFQQPFFLAVMMAITALFAANLFGAFEIALPRFAADRLGSSRRPGLTGSFLTGAFATLLATPCSAPYVGTAVGFALAGSDTDILEIFAALGLGLALPYLAAAAFPAAARVLPRPGRWMIWLRKLMGVALLGTALWLGFVLTAELSSAPNVAPEAFWRPFQRQQISSLVASGRVVFVDVTAEWCLTCQVNRRLVLDQSTIRSRLAADDVVAMQADWTRPDAGIADYLRSYGRFGIPFNAVYGPGAPQGIALSELLSVDEVLAALARAKGAANASGSALQTPSGGG
jgi:suppressor for copper-sensitivity B